ncbi:MAG: hypothetical protein QMD46_12215 [Methanomicrobiales archaeon]|nr:hypothetical protein [Methanomicrobiales archaeon]
MTGEIPHLQEYRVWLERQAISEEYRRALVMDLLRIRREYGSLPSDIEKFTTDYLEKQRLGRVRRIQIRIALRRYCEFRWENYRIPFHDP